MNTLGKILQQDALVARESIKLDSLQKQYVKENRKFSKGDTIQFKKYNDDDNFIIGQVERIYFREVAGKGLIQYQMIRVNADGSKNKRDRSFYYRHEKEIKSV